MQQTRSHNKYQVTLQQKNILILTNIYEFIFVYILNIKVTYCCWPNCLRKPSKLFTKRSKQNIWTNLYFEIEIVLAKTNRLGVLSKTNVFINHHEIVYSTRKIDAKTSKYLNKFMYSTTTSPVIKHKNNLQTEFVTFGVLWMSQISKTFQIIRFTSATTVMFENGIKSAVTWHFWNLPMKWRASFNTHQQQNRTISSFTLTTSRSNLYYLHKKNQSKVNKET